jgi:hypothetical protein
VFVNPPCPRVEDEVHACGGVPATKAVPPPGHQRIRCICGLSVPAAGPADWRPHVAAPKLKMASVERSHAQELAGPPAAQKATRRHHVEYVLDGPPLARRDTRVKRRGLWFELGLPPLFTHPTGGEPSCGFLERNLRRRPVALRPGGHGQTRAITWPAACAAYNPPGMSSTAHTS